MAPMQRVHTLPDDRTEIERLRAENQNLRAALEDMQSLNMAEAQGTTAARRGQLDSYNPYPAGSMPRIYWATGFHNETRHARLRDLVQGFRQLVTRLESDPTAHHDLGGPSRMIEGLVRRYESQGDG